MGSGGFPAGSRADLCKASSPPGPGGRTGGEVGRPASPVSPAERTPPGPLSLRMVGDIDGRCPVSFLPEHTCARLASQVFVSLSFLWCLLSCCWWPGGPAVGGRVSPPSPVGPEVLMGKELRGHSRGRGASILTRKQLAGPKPGSIAATCWVRGSPASVLSPVDTQQLHQAVVVRLSKSMLSVNW